jgi:hypothetical protein
MSKEQGKDSEKYFYVFPPLKMSRAAMFKVKK